MMMGHFISRLFESVLHVEKNTRAIQNRKHCACATRSSPPADSPAKMTRDRFRIMTLAPGRKCPGNVVQMREAMAAFIGSDSVAVSFHCK